MQGLKLSLRQLQVFKAVAEQGSTSLAAPVLALSQSATSAALNELEHQLGLDLFDRVGKRLLLNHHGRTLLPQALAVLDGAAAIEAWAQDADFQAGGLRIGASTTIGNYLLPQMLADFRRGLAYSRSGGRQDVVSIANTSAVIEQLLRFELDLALIEGPCHEPELKVLPWLEDELVIVCAPDSPLLPTPGEKQGLEALAETTWLLREAGSGTREIINQALIPHLHQLHSGIEFGNSEAIKRAAAAGLGITCLSRYVVADMLASGHLVELPSVLPKLTRYLHLLVHRKKQASGGLTRLVEHILAYRSGAL
jgi:DNA-binding transcriptional LysR family regulator